jgi:hypothetical protein
MRFDSALWLATDDVMVLQSPKKPGGYLLIDGEQKEKVSATLLKG